MGLGVPLSRGDFFGAGPGEPRQAALTPLVYAWATAGLPRLAERAVGVFVVVALVGAWINLNFHSKRLPLPKGTVVLHGVVAVAAFVMLLLALMSPH